jgi:hypothetical protein
MNLKPLLAAFLFIPAIVFAQTVPNMIGTWKGTGNATVMGSYGHHVSGQRNKVHVNHVPFTMIIDHQEGVNFWGIFSSKDFKEEIIAAISIDLQGGIMVDSDGIYNFKLPDSNTIQMCYAQLQKPKVAACQELKKQ